MTDSKRNLAPAPGLFHVELTARASSPADVEAYERAVAVARLRLKMFARWNPSCVPLDTELAPPPPGQ